MGTKGLTKAVLLKEKRDLYIIQQMRCTTKFVTISQNRSNAGTSTNRIKISNKNELTKYYDT